jgi:hypothetical protein
VSSTAKVFKAVCMLEEGGRVRRREGEKEEGRESVIERECEREQVEEVDCTGGAER